MFVGFGLCGTPGEYSVYLGLHVVRNILILTSEVDTLIGALAQRKDVTNLTAVSNNVGSGERGLGASSEFSSQQYQRRNV